MFKKIYENLIIEKPKLTLLILTILLFGFGYFIKDFQLDASSDTLLLENDPDLKYLREVNAKYGAKDFFVLTYTPKTSLLSDNTIKNLTGLKIIKHYPVKILIKKGVLMKLLIVLFIRNS